MEGKNSPSAGCALLPPDLPPLLSGAHPPSPRQAHAHVCHRSGRETELAALRPDAAYPRIGRRGGGGRRARVGGSESAGERRGAVPPGQPRPRRGYTSCAHVPSPTSAARRRLLPADQLRRRLLLQPPEPRALTSSSRSPTTTPSARPSRCPSKLPSVRRRGGAAARGGLDAGAEGVGLGRGLQGRVQLRAAAGKPRSSPSETESPRGCAPNCTSPRPAPGASGSAAAAGVVGAGKRPDRASRGSLWPLKSRGALGTPEPEGRRASPQLCALRGI